MNFRFAILAAAALLGGCAANSYCLEEFDYQKAQSVPPIRGTEGLAIPDSPSALRIPPAAPDTEPYGKKVKDDKGDEKIVCLDRPPAMPPLAPLPEPEPAKPATADPAPAAADPAAPAAQTPPPEKPAN